MDLDFLKKGCVLDGDSGNDPAVLPEWMDMERFRRGQKFFLRHISSITFALHCSLTVGFGVQNLIEPLSFTRKSNTARTSLLRYVKTFVHLALWQLEDIWDPTNLGHRSIQTVRRMHRKVRESMEEEGGRKNGGTRQRYLSQYDMALVQSGFVGVVLAYPREFGIVCTREELDDYVFCWRGIGYLLGIRDEYNICSDGYGQALRLVKEIEDQVVDRGLRDRPPAFDTLSNAYIDGSNLPLKFRFYTKESIIYYLLNMTGRSIPPWLQCTWTDRIRVFGYRLLTFLFGWAPGFERFHNYLMMNLFKKASYLIDKEIGKFYLCPMS